MTLTTYSEVPWNAPYYERCGFHRLDEAQWTPSLRAIRAAEAAAGLDRVAAGLHGSRLVARGASVEACVEASRPFGRPYVDDLTPDDVHAAALQYVRKVAGMRAPSGANQAVFDHAVERDRGGDDHPARRPDDPGRTRVLAERSLRPG